MFLAVLSLSCSPVFAQRPSALLAAGAAADPERSASAQLFQPDVPAADPALVFAPVSAPAPSATLARASLPPTAYLIDFGPHSPALPSANYSSSRVPSFPGPDSGGKSHPGITPVISPQPRSEKFHWRPALVQSARFLAVQHAFRLSTEPSTRQELGGKFFSDYFDSVLGFGGWRDGDPFMVNYIGHSMQGSVTGYIQVRNDPKGQYLELENSKAYWHSRLKATAWSGVYSLQFEFGPFSEASLGNVGKMPPQAYEHDINSKMATVDLVITPVAGLGWMLAEDALDKYLVKRIERKTDNRVLRALARSVLNPSRSFANAMASRLPWHRDTRPLRGSPTGSEISPPALRPETTTQPGQQ